jgi:hypothetical protein
MNNIYLIGAGGVGSWLAPAICLLCGHADQVTVIDGDKLEKKNLNRQLFTNEDIGAFKAEALADRYGCNYRNQFYTHNSIQLEHNDWLLCCVDNNAGRKAVLDSVDEFGCQAIFGCNETTSAEAYFYKRDWKGKPSDPRIYYPSLTEDDGADPISRSIGCTGAAQKQNPQLVSANFAAASLIQMLFVLWCLERPKFNREAVMHLPIRIRQNMTRFETFKLNDYENDKREILAKG